MAMFHDRTDAGKQLAAALVTYQDKNVLVLAIPKGGMEVGYQVAKYLRGDFSIVVSRKLPFPDNPEAGFGAIAEDGSMWLFERAAQLVPPAVIERIIQKQGQEISRRIDVLRGGNPLPSIKGRCVVLVDDGIAAGSTMRASIRLCRNQHADKIVVAAPVASSGVKNQLEAFVDEIVILKTPPGFQAVADAYANWYDVSDQEALEIMRRWEREVEARETP